MKSLISSQTWLHQLIIDNTAGGTPKDFPTYVARYLSASTGIQFIDTPNNLEQLYTYNIIVELSGTLNTLSVSLSE